MKKLVNFLSLSLTTELSSVSAQLTKQDDIVSYNNTNQQRNIWYKKTENSMTPMSKMQKDNMMRTNNKTQKEQPLYFKNSM